MSRVLYFAVRTVADTSIDIPNRAAFKASEVCEIAQIPSYVLRSWEKEFPGLGRGGAPGRPADLPARRRRADPADQAAGVHRGADARRRAGGRSKATRRSRTMPVAAPTVRARDVKAGWPRRARSCGRCSTCCRTPVGEAGAAPDDAEAAADVAAAEAAREAPAAVAGRTTSTRATLPLLETPDEPAPKPRRTRRGAAHARRASKVE